MLVATKKTVPVDSATKLISEVLLIFEITPPIGLKVPTAPLMTKVLVAELVRAITRLSNDVSVISLPWASSTVVVEVLIVPLPAMVVPPAVMVISPSALTPILPSNASLRLPVIFTPPANEMREISPVCVSILPSSVSKETLLAEVMPVSAEMIIDLPETGVATPAIPGKLVANPLRKDTSPSPPVIVPKVNNPPPPGKLIVIFPPFEVIWPMAPPAPLSRAPDPEILIVPEPVAFTPPTNTMLPELVFTLIVPVPVMVPALRVKSTPASSVISLPAILP